VTTVRQESDPDPNPADTLRASASEPSGSIPVTDDPANAPRRTTRQVIEEWQPRLQAILADWAKSLPEDAAVSWPGALVYVRESYAKSLVGDAPDVQLRTALGLLAQRRIYVAPENLFFDVESATDMISRAAFQRLFEKAFLGGIKAIGFAVNDRLFRNLEQSLRVKGQFRRNAIELIHVGQWQGDQRHPAAWQAEVAQDTHAEYQARTTSYNVGTHFEAISRDGKPISKLPEAYVAAARAPSFLGRQGSVIAWALVEPLASVIKAGCDRYLAGDSLSDLAAWAATTKLGGVTPAGRVMNRRWWYWTLNNPKFAGYQFATYYVGFRPDSRSRRRKGGPDRPLVPCKLPPLWDLDTYHEIQRLAHARAHSAKTRRSYKPYLLTGIAYDPRCGHRMKVVQAMKNGHFWMQCHVLGSGGAHGKASRGDIAQRELDEILADLSFDDTALLRQVEEELRALSSSTEVAQSQFRPDPAIGAVRSALAALESAGINESREQLRAKLAALEAADLERRELLHAPVASFRRALGELEDWARVWREGDLFAKNEVLRAAGVHVELALDPEVGDRVFHVVSISADNPAFGLALTAALDRSRHLVARGPSAYPMTRIAVTTNGRGTESSAVAGTLARPVYAKHRSPNNEPPAVPAGWLALADYARLTRMPEDVVRRRLSAGQVVGRRVRHKGRFWWLVETPTNLAA